MKKKIIVVIVLIVIIVILGILIHGLSSKKDKPASDNQTIVSEMGSSDKDEVAPSEQTDSTSSENANEAKAGNEDFKPGSEEFVVELEEDEAFDIN